MTAYPAYDSTAHCRRPGVDPGRFHPSPGVQPDEIRATKALCTGGDNGPPCPFLVPCREYGLAHAVHGYWGGYGENERRAERRRRRIVPEPMPSAVMDTARRPDSTRNTDPSQRRCGVCGKAMQPGSLARHRREIHSEAVAS